MDSTNPTPRSGGVLSLLRRFGLTSGRNRGDAFSMFDASGEAWLVTDLSGGTVYITNIWKISFPAGVGDGQGLGGLRSLGSEATVAAEIERIFKTATQGTTAHGEIRIEASNGRPEWWRLRATPDGRGHVFWRADDVTTQRERETLGRLESEMVTDFLDNLPVGFFALDANGAFSYVNSTLARWLRRDAGALSAGDIRVQDILGEGNDLPGDGVGYVTMRNPDGDAFRAFVIQNNRGHSGRYGVGVRAVVLRDPESGKDVEPDARSSNAADGDHSLPGWLFDDAPIGLALLKEDGSIQSCNHALARFFGANRDALRGTLLTSHVSAEDRDEVNAALSKLVMGTARAIHAEVRLPGDGADARAASLHAARMESADGTNGAEDTAEEGCGIILHVIDETEQRHLEVQFTQSQKMQAIGQLAGGVAHDFNNLLTVISGHAELAAITLNKQDPLHDDLKEIQNAAHRAAQLTRQLLAFSRKQTLQPKILDMNDIVRELDKMLKRVIGEDIDLETIAAPDLWRVNADPGQIEQVIINLAINARDAMPGGGKLVIETQNVELDEEYTGKHPEVKPGPHVMLAISDNGCGMKEELKSQIFEPFFTTKEKGKGTGLGLSTVYGIVKQSGGSIWVYSELDAGTTFKVYLPMVTQEADELSREADVSEAPRGTETILLVEDEEGVRKLAVRILKKLGYKVLDAESGVDALVMCQNRKKPVDIVVTDVVMPNMSGAEFIEKLREFWSDFKVLYMSGYTSNAIVHAGVLDKGTPYLQKPFRPVDIARKVRKVLDD